MSEPIRKRILLFYPPNNRSVAIETLSKAVTDAGHQVILLTFTEKGPFHEALEKFGIPTYTYVIPRTNSWKYIYRHIRHLIRFCKEHKIDTVWSHLQEANIIAVLAKPFLKQRLVTFRHHDETSFYVNFSRKLGLQRNKNEILFDKIINRLSPEIIVPSIGVYNAMKDYETVNMEKVKIMPYFYNFSRYQQPNDERVRAIREKYSAKLLVIMVARMIHSKMHLSVFEAINKLSQMNLDIRLLVMDSGPLEAKLKQYVIDNQLESVIFFSGFQNNVLDYMKAADMLIHPSLVESFGHVPLEMGYIKRPVMVCKGVGIFDQLVTDGVNGFQLDPNSLGEELEQKIEKAYHSIDQLPILGQALHEKVMQDFNFAEEDVYKQCKVFC